MMSLRMLETAGFFTIAAALHVSAAAMMLPQDELEKGAAMDAPPASLAAGGPEAQALVEAWETEPDTAEQPEQVQPEPESADLPDASVEEAPQMAALPDMAPPMPTAARPNLPPPPELEPVPEPEPEPEPRIDPATLDLPDLQQMTPPDIKPDTALVASARPDRKPARPKPQPKVEPQPETQARPEPASPAPARAAEAQPARRQGNGGTSQASGQGGGGGGVSAQTRANLKAQWGAQINQCLARQLSRISGGRGQQVNIDVTVARSGQIQGASLAGSTGNARVDQQIQRALQRTGRCPAAPAGVTEAAVAFRQPFALR
ncbi:energy transducer TonB family protein [Paracoccus sediminilitoris]|uniref:energy transducer TonB family protein n=1 Tax=Paracoccus sediminilitoris TaxID=2202419 RepID=UPI000DB9B282|nr:energy transducer TonB [Paracoccus sediminilitoris]